MSVTTEVPNGTLTEIYAQIGELIDRATGLQATNESDEQVFDLAVANEVLGRKIAALGHRRLVDMTDRSIPAKHGLPRLRDFLAMKLHIPNPGFRMKMAAQLEPLYAPSGELLEPLCPALAAAGTEGAAAPEHISAALSVIEKIPRSVDVDQRRTAEALLGDFVRDKTPDQIRKLGARILAHLDPDGDLTDDRERHRHRGLVVAGQDAQLMSSLTATLMPTTRAMLDQVLAMWAAPGMNNPDDPHSPGGNPDGTDKQRLEAAEERDTRSQPQRNHDALHALLRAVLDTGALGRSHRGMDPHLIVTITESELRERAGIGHATGGADLPIQAILELAARAHHHLAVFTDHTNIPLYFGRAKRLASQEQRFTLFAQYQGCSTPGCQMPFSHTEAHHTPDWQDGGCTDVDDLAPACGPHNRSVGAKPGQWSTHRIMAGPDAGLIGWTLNPPTPPPTTPWTPAPPLDGVDINQRAPNPPPPDPHTNTYRRIRTLLQRKHRHIEPTPAGTPLPETRLTATSITPHKAATMLYQPWRDDA